jgi:hypothetical protein
VRRVPLIHVYAVDDPVEVSFPELQHALEAEAVFGFEDFPGIGPAHGIQEVRVKESRLEKIHLPVEFEPLGHKEVPSQTGVRHVACVKITLVAEVMYGQKGGGLSELPLRLYRVFR